MVKSNFVPKWFEPNKIDINNPPPDPGKIVSEAASYCVQNPGKKKIIEKRIQEELKIIPPECRKWLEIEHEKGKNEMRTSTTVLKEKIVLFLLLA